MRDLLAGNQPAEQELIFVLIVVLLAPNIGIAILDTIIHDGIVGKVISYCHPNNLSSLCEEIREEEGLKPGDQLGIGNSYQFGLRGVITFVAIGFGVTRLVIGVLARRGINIMLIIISASWAWSATVLFYFGWSDFLYYVLRGLPLPESLPWLQNIGFMFLVEWIEPNVTVSLNELFALMAIGTSLFAAPWIFLMHHFHKGTLEDMGLIQELD